MLTALLDKRLLLPLLAGTAVIGLSACSDSTSEIISEGETDAPPPPPPPTGGGGGGTPPPAGGACGSGFTEVSVGASTVCLLGENAELADLDPDTPTTLEEDLTIPSGTIFLFDGAFFVGADQGASASGVTTAQDPATLTIEPGAIIVGASTSARVVVNRGSQIQAIGEQDNPIVFTSAQDAGLAEGLGLETRAGFDGNFADDPNTAEWGGLIINGRAPLNVCQDLDEGQICTKLGEGDSGEFGGDDPNDNSGTLEFVQVRYAGFEVTPEDELNGIAFQGVGDATTIDFIQVHNNADDGIEFFGGTANASHVVITGASDDSIDWTDGWQGNLQYGLVLQNPSLEGDRGIEADNLEENENATPRSMPNISNLTLIGVAEEAGGAIGDTGILLRRGTGGQYFNIVATNWPDACFDLDTQATFDLAVESSSTAENADLRLGSALFDCDDPTEDDEEETNDAGDIVFEDPFNLETWFTAGANNVIGDSSLTGFQNGPAEDQVTVTDPTAFAAFFDSVDFVGAVPSDAAGFADQGNWTLGWTFGLNPEPQCPTEVDGIAETADGCVIGNGQSITLTGDVRLEAGIDYLLDGQVIVGEVAPADMNAMGDFTPSSLTIDAGVRIEGLSTASSLVVARGNQIFANGTRQAPIVLTAELPDGQTVDTATALWGGLVINGQAPLNVCAGPAICTKLGEGDSGDFGGNNPMDDSGRLSFLRVEFAGFEVTPEDELNGIAFQGVGSGTEIEFIQVHNNADDGIEFFGGTANARWVVITGASDDSIDWTDGWQGNLQFGVVVQNPQLAGDRGIEADNLEENENNTPRSMPNLSNLTFVGVDTRTDPEGAIGDTGILLRRGTAGQFFNIVATDWPDACLDLDTQATFDQADSASSTAMGANLRIGSFLADCTDATEDGEEETDDMGTVIFTDPFTLQTWFLAGTGNTIGTAATLRVPSGGGKPFINGSAENNANLATDPATLSSFFDGFGFDEGVDYRGAVESPANDFTEGWTIWLDQPFAGQ